MNQKPTISYFLIYIMLRVGTEKVYRHQTIMLAADNLPLRQQHDLLSYHHHEKYLHLQGCPSGFLVSLPPWYLGCPSAEPSPPGPLQPSHCLYSPWLCLLVGQYKVAVSRSFKANQQLRKDCTRCDIFQIRSLILIASSCILATRFAF